MYSKVSHWVSLKQFHENFYYFWFDGKIIFFYFQHWQVPLSKRFRALKLWFVIRNYGVKGLQAHIRKGVRLAQKFESLILSDERFEIPAKRHLGMVVFRLKGENDQTEKLLKKLNGSGKMHAVPASLKGTINTVHRNFFVSSTIFLPLRFYVKSNLPFFLNRQICHSIHCNITKDHFARYCQGLEFDSSFHWWDHGRWEK